jgi:lysophospholipase L1-like esterase
MLRRFWKSRVGGAQMDNKKMVGPSNNPGGDEPPNAADPLPPRRLGRRIAALVVSVLLALFIVEIMLQVVGFSYELRANIVQGAKGNEPRNSAYECIVDRDLIWIPTRFPRLLEAARGASPDFLFLGDSCTEGGIYDALFAELARGRLPERTYTITKLGATGWSTEQGLRLLRREGPAIKPRVATFYYGWNDHWNSIGLTDREVLRLNATPLFWFRGLRLGQLAIKARVGWQAARQGQAPLRVPPAMFRENLIALVEESRGAGIVPVLITAPSSHEAGREPAILAPRWVTNLADLIPLHQQYAAIVRAVAAEHDVILCDLAAYFEKLPREAVRDVYFKDDGIHLNEAGDRLIAEALYDCFLEHSLIGTNAADKPRDEREPSRSEPRP